MCGQGGHGCVVVAAVGSRRCNHTHSPASNPASYPFNRWRVRVRPLWPLATQGGRGGWCQRRGGRGGARRCNGRGNWHCYWVRTPLGSVHTAETRTAAKLATVLLPAAIPTHACPPCAVALAAICPRAGGGAARNGCGAGGGGRGGAASGGGEKGQRVRRAAAPHRHVSQAKPSLFSLGYTEQCAALSSLSTREALVEHA